MSIFAETATWGDSSMVNKSSDRARSPTKEFVDLSASYLPTLKVIAICAAVAWATWWANDLSNNVEQTSRDVAAMSKTLSDTSQNSAVAIEAMEQRLIRLEREHALLKDYTEGRIGSMPYRPSQPMGTQ